METIEYYKNIEHEEWRAYYTFTSYHFRLRKIVRQANWNKNILCRVTLNRNDREIHRLRFERLIDETNEIKNKWRELNYQYDPSRINKIINQLTKLKNYEFKNSQYQGQTIRHRK